MSDFFGKVSESTNTTGAVSLSHTLMTSSYTITFHLSSAPTTSGNFTVTLDAINGSAYDTVIYNRDLAASPAITDLIIIDRDAVFKAGDALVISYPNADNRTYGLQIVSGKVN